MTVVAFFAPGTPQPQGSKSAIVRGGRAVVVEGRRGKARNAFTEWRATVRIAAAAARGAEAEPFAGPVALRVHFSVPRPTSAPKTRRTWAAKRPDLDKLVRAVLDAMTEAAVWGDDAQVVHVVATKDYPLVDGRTGAWVQATPLDHGGVERLDVTAAMAVANVDAQAVPA